MAGKIEHQALPRASFQNEPKVLIVVAPYYQSIAENLLKGAKKEISASNGTDADISFLAPFSKFSAMDW